MFNLQMKLTHFPLSFFFTKSPQFDNVLTKYRYLGHCQNNSVHRFEEQF